MQSLFEQKALNEIIARICLLSPNSQNLWGKMNVDQMLAHCSVGMETALGLKYFPQVFLGKLIGRFVKSIIMSDKPFRKSGPTHPGFIISKTMGFDKEKNNLIVLVKLFHEGGHSKCTTNPHSFFGKLTPHEWGLLMYKHLDHHLSQFGV